MTEVGRRSFPNEARSVAGARRFVESELDDLPPDVVATAQLLVSELATNAVVHTAASFEVLAERSAAARRVRVAVRDEGPGEPAPRELEPLAEHGRGLLLVEALADRWGVDPADGQPGKTVWFELAAPLDDSALDGSSPSAV